MDEEKRQHDEVDAILEDIMGTVQAKEEAVTSEEPPMPEEPSPTPRETGYVSFEEDDMLAEDIGATRVLSDGEDDVRVYGGASSGSAASAAGAQSAEATQVISVAEDGETEEEAEEPQKKKRKSRNREAIGCLKAIIYVFAVLLISIVLAMLIFKAFTDVTGIGRSTTSINIEVPEGASTQDVAQMLADQDVIEEPMFFRLYCRLVGADGTFHPGVHIVSSNMGYDGIVEVLQTLEQSQTVTVMIEEGATIDRIASILEANDVCTAADFYEALITGDYEDYEFIAELTPEQRKNRIYLLEGYLFPDTYEFYVDGSPEAVVRTMLDNFDKRVDADTRAAIKASGKTLNDVLIAASIVQMEAGNKEDMPRVMRVIENRLAIDMRLQMDSTEDYLLNGVAEALDTAYNTYERQGLPVGAICNPGLEAIHAALNPSQEPEIIECLYFASVDNNESPLPIGTTKFFEEEEDHVAWCIEHHIGMYANY